MSHTHVTCHIRQHTVSAPRGGGGRGRRTGFIDFPVAHEQTGAGDNHLQGAAREPKAGGDAGGQQDSPNAAAAAGCYHGIILARLDGVNAARFAPVALLEKNGFRPKQTRVRALLKRLRTL